MEFGSEDETFNLFDTDELKDTFSIPKLNKITGNLYIYFYIKLSFNCYW